MNSTKSSQPNYAAHPICRNGETVSKFCFTYALDGGAWLEMSNGRRDWYCWAHIRHWMGQRWIDANLRAQGWMTGCWVAAQREISA